MERHIRSKIGNKRMLFFTPGSSQKNGLEISTFYQRLQIASNFWIVAKPKAKANESFNNNSVSKIVFHVKKYF